MPKTITLILVAIIAPAIVCPLADAQSGPKRRTPALTTDDLGSTRMVVTQPADSDAQPSVIRDTGLGTIAWHRDLRRALEVARAEGKLVVVDVYTDWCGWCKKMDRTIYTDPAIVALSRQQVFVKVNAEDGGNGQRFAEQMRVTGYPTTLVLDGQGKVLNVARGYIASPGAFGEFVEEARVRVK
jgi:thiol:disulfide interchange protein